MAVRGRGTVADPTRLRDRHPGGVRGLEGYDIEDDGLLRLSRCVRYLVYGLVSGMLLAICVDRIILSSVILAYLNIFTASLFAILIGAAEAAPIRMANRLAVKMFR